MTQAYEIGRPSPRASRGALRVVDVTEFWSERGGGVRSYLTTKGRALARLGVAHTVLASGPRDEESTLADEPGCRSALVRFRGPSLPYDSTYNLFSRFAAMRERVSIEKPDVLEIHSPELAALGALSTPRRDFGVRTLVWHSDFIDTYLAWRIERATSTLIADAVTAPLWSWVRAIARRCAATIAASGSQAQKLRNHGVPRVHELRFGVDTGVFRPEARDEAFRRQVLGDREIPLFVCSGRLAGEKRWDVVIDGFERVRSRRQAVLLVFGDGPERAVLEARAKHVPDVRFVGFERDRARLARALASADALVHAGPFETFGLAVAEAVACGTPVVVASAGAARELADPGCSEEYAWGSAEAFSAAVERLFARDQSVLGRRAREAAGRVVSVEQHFGALVALYRELLRASRAEAAGRGDVA